MKSNIATLGFYLALDCHIKQPRYSKAEYIIERITIEYIVNHYLLYDIDIISFQEQIQNKMDSRAKAFLTQCYYMNGESVLPIISFQMVFLSCIQFVKYIRKYILLCPYALSYINLIQKSNMLLSLAIPPFIFSHFLFSLFA